MLFFAPTREVVSRTWYRRVPGFPVALVSNVYSYIQLNMNNQSKEQSMKSPEGRVRSVFPWYVPSEHVSGVSVDDITMQWVKGRANDVFGLLSGDFGPAAPTTDDVAGRARIGSDLSRRLGTLNLLEESVSTLDEKVGHAGYQKSGRSRVVREVARSMVHIALGGGLADRDRGYFVNPDTVLAQERAARRAVGASSAPELADGFVRSTLTDYGYGSGVVFSKGLKKDPREVWYIGQRLLAHALGNGFSLSLDEMAGGDTLCFPISELLDAVRESGAGYFTVGVAILNSPGWVVRGGVAYHRERITAVADATNMIIGQSGALTAGVDNLVPGGFDAAMAVALRFPGPGTVPSNDLTAVIGGPLSAREQVVGVLSGADGPMSAPEIASHLSYGTNVVNNVLSRHRGEVFSRPLHGRWVLHGAGYASREDVERVLEERGWTAEELSAGRFPSRVDVIANDLDAEPTKLMPTIFELAGKHRRQKVASKGRRNSR